MGQMLCWAARPTVLRSQPRPGIYVEGCQAYTSLGLPHTTTHYRARCNSYDSWLLQVDPRPDAHACLPKVALLSIQPRRS